MTDDLLAGDERRRAFLRVVSRAALAMPFLSFAGCARRQQDSEAKGDSADPKWAALTADLEQRLPDLLAKATTVPAVSMALVADAKLIWRGAFGVKDFVSRTAVDSQTVFEAASVSKTVFAYEIMKLCEKRVLELDTPLTHYTPDRFLKGDPRLDLITARHVLSHTTGFPNWRSKAEPLSIHFTPGERWSYSGEGYSYLQSVMTHLTGHVDTKDCKTFGDDLTVCATDFDAYMKAHLFVPFGMTSSGYLYQEGMARPHDDKGRMNDDRKSTAIDAARYGSAGNLHTTPSDYAKFLIEFIDPKSADAFRLSAASVKEMVRPQVKLTDRVSWGLGWAIDHTPAGGDVISHSGDNPGFKTLTAASIRRKSAFMIMTNGDRGFDDVIAKVVTSDLMQQFLPVNLKA